MILCPYDPDWPTVAAAEIAAWEDAVTGLAAVYHIGSTSVPGLAAKPVIDLLPVFETEDAADAARTTIETLGYEWLGEYGLLGRRYVRKSNPGTGRRLIQAHCYARGHPDIARHLAFRNWLRSDAAHRDGYAAEKARCADLHPTDGQAYGACKSAWIDEAEGQALREGWDQR